MKPSTIDEAISIAVSIKSAVDLYVSSQFDSSMSSKEFLLKTFAGYEPCLDFTKGADESQSIYVNKYVGLPYEVAEDALVSDGFYYRRVVYRDGTHMLLTRDFKPKRANLYLHRNIVIGVSTG